MATDNPLQATPLYHGTRDASARIILRDGFRRSRSRSYTGTGICLSESLTVAYEYGMYETGGCILEARLAPHARWADGFGDTTPSRDGWDANFEASGLGAVRGDGGNVGVVWAGGVVVWVVGGRGVVVWVRGMSHREASRRVCAEFDEDGPQCGYNGVVQDYASIWENQAARDPNLTRFPDHHRELTARLQRMTGRTQSTRA